MLVQMLNNEVLLWHLPGGTKRKQGKNSLRKFTVSAKIKLSISYVWFLMTKEIKLFCVVFMTILMKSIRILSVTNYVKIIDMTSSLIYFPSYIFILSNIDPCDTFGSKHLIPLL